MLNETFSVIFKHRECIFLVDNSVKNYTNGLEYYFVLIGPAA